MTITSFEIEISEAERNRVQDPAIFTGFPWPVTIRKWEEGFLLVFEGSLNEGYIPNVRLSYSKGVARFSCGYYENARFVRFLLLFGLVLNLTAALLGPPGFAFKLLLIALFTLFMWAMFFFSFCFRLQKWVERRLELSRRHPGLEEFLS